MSSPESPAHILIVEDEEGLRFLMKAFLSHDGYEVTEAAHGNQALKILAENATFDLIITDLEMPQISGEQFLTELLSRSMNIPVLVTSAHINKRAMALELGARDYLTKPFGYEEISKVVKRMLDKVE